MQCQLTLSRLRSLLPEHRMVGQRSADITGVASLKEAGPGDLSFLANPKYRQDALHSQAGVILVPEDFQAEPSEGTCFIYVSKPSQALAIVCRYIEDIQSHRPQAGIHPSAVIAEGAQIDPTAFIGPQVVVEAGAVIGAGCRLHGQNFIGPEARLGADCLLYAGAQVAAHCVLEERVTLHQGAVVGSDGFGFDTRPGTGHQRIPQIGIVYIEQDVEVGANATIDRARFSETRIGAGTKIDNLVQIAHNVKVGKHCIICAQAGIAGSTTVEDWVVLAGQVGISGHITIGQGAQIGAQSGVAKSIPAGGMVTGTPARDLKEQRKLEALMRRLPDIWRFLKQSPENAESEQ